MLISRAILIILTFGIMTILLIAGMNYIVAATYTFVIVMILYIIIGHIRNKKRISLLEDDCNPQAFIAKTEKQINITGKNPKIAAYLNIDMAAGLISMGEFSDAKKLLLSIDKSKLSVKNGTLLIYTINLISCLYELGEIDEGEKLFEFTIPLLAPINKNMTLATEILIAERLYFLERYEESEKQFKELLNNKISCCKKVNIIYRLAQIDEKAGNILGAKKKYRKVAEKGNGLWVCEEAKKHIT